LWNEAVQNGTYKIKLQNLSTQRDLQKKESINKRKEAQAKKKLKNANFQSQNSSTLSNSNQNSVIDSEVLENDSESDFEEEEEENYEEPSIFINSIQKIAIANNKEVNSDSNSE
jgi:hypothetical protein